LTVSETNLKSLSAVHKTSDIELEKFRQMSGFLDCEEPHVNLYKFVGTLHLEHNDPISVDIKQFILRGCTLKNTHWIVGLVAYAGADTKMMLNLRDPPSKFSTMEKTMNRIVLMLVGFTLILMLTDAVGAGVSQVYINFFFLNLLVHQPKKPSLVRRRHSLIPSRTNGTFCVSGLFRNVWVLNPSFNDGNPRNHTNSASQTNGI
jgi:magnesium-transporting ATPase (P-type)